MERKILVVLVAKELDDGIKNLIAAHKAVMKELEFDPEQLREFLWELVGEAVTLRKKKREERLA